MDEGEHQIGYKVLPRGTPVVASDGTEIGTVARVLDNAREHIFDGIVVRTDDGRRFVDAPEVARITNRQVTLTIDAAEARELPPPRAAAAGAGCSAADVRFPRPGARQPLGGTRRPG